MLYVALINQLNIIATRRLSALTVAAYLTLC